VTRDDAIAHVREAVERIDPYLVDEAIADLEWRLNNAMPDPVRHAIFFAVALRQSDMRNTGCACPMCCRAWAFGGARCDGAQVGPDVRDVPPWIDDHPSLGTRTSVPAGTVLE
jgi:hypothetical protein